MLIDIRSTGNFIYQPAHLKNCYAKTKSSVIAIQERNIDNATESFILLLFKKYLQSTQHYSCDHLLH